MPSVIVEPRRILIRSVNWLGDAVMTLPALQRVRERFPEAHITVFTHKKLKDLWTFCPAIDEVLTFGRHTTVFSAAQALRAQQFDLALILPNSPRSALEAWLARIPSRVGFSRPFRSLFLTHPIDSQSHALMHKRSDSEIRQLIEQGSPAQANTAPADVGTQHSIFHYLELCSAIGVRAEALPPTLIVPQSELQNGRQNLGRQIPGGESPRAPALLLGLHPSAAYGTAKKWPAENFAATARAISKKFSNSVWLLFGENKDREECEKIGKASGARYLNLAGRTSLRELIVSLANCKLLLTNDSGPMHVAAALGTPVAAIFGSTSPALTGPGLPGDNRFSVLYGNAPCSPCFRRTCPIDLRCFAAVTPEAAAEAALRQLQPYA